MGAYEKYSQYLLQLIIKICRQSAAACRISVAWMITKVTECRTCRTKYSLRQSLSRYTGEPFIRLLAMGGWSLVVSCNHRKERIRNLLVIVLRGKTITRTCASRRLESRRANDNRGDCTRRASARQSINRKSSKRD